MEKNNCFETDDATDRISSLPDAVRAHILSFLSTKEAVGTCVLSKVWIRTWACVPVLDINLEEFGGRTCEEMEAKFEQFLKGVFKNREPLNLEKFKLVWYTEDCVSYNSGAFEGCILQALKFKPRILSLSFCWQELYSLDAGPIFTCASLRDVMFEQDWCHHFEIAPSSIHLPCLKKLHLICMKVNDDFVNKLFFGCPILEELFLHNCNLNIYKISSGKLKNLSLMSNHHDEQSWEISTPSLVNLEINTVLGHMEGISLNKMASLLNASIHFDTPFDYIFTNSEPKFLSFLSNVTKLDLALTNAQLEWLLEKEVPNCQIFSNLKTLKLGCWCMSNDFELVAFFLRSPNLQRLTLYHCNAFSIPGWEWEDDTEENSSQEETGGALFQQKQLEIVKIINVGVPHDECTDLLVNKLQAHVKTIVKIIIRDYGSSTLLRVF